MSVIAHAPYEAIAFLSKVYMCLLFPIVTARHFDFPLLSSAFLSVSFVRALPADEPSAVET